MHVEKLVRMIIIVSCINFRESYWKCDVITLFPLNVISDITLEVLTLSISNIIFTNANLCLRNCCG